MKIIHAEMYCAYCGNILPVVDQIEKRLSSTFEFSVLEMGVIEHIHGYFFHTHCTEKPEFGGWFGRFLQKKRK